MAPSTATPSPAEIALLERQTNDTKIFVFVIIFTVLAVSATTIRVTSRYAKKALIGLDDILVIVALVIIHPDT